MDLALDQRKQPWERDVRKRPELTNLTDGAIRVFLREEEEYQQLLVAEGRPPIALRQLINPLVLTGIPRLVRNVSSSDAALLPSKEQLARGDRVPDPEASTFEEEDTDIEAGELWERIVRRTLEKILRARTESLGVSVTELETTVRRSLHWDGSEPVGTVALNQFLASFSALDAVLGIRERLPDGGQTGKRLSQLLTSKVEPPAFRERVSEVAALRSVNSYDGWFDLVLELLPLYDGSQLNTSTPPQRATGGWKQSSRNWAATRPSLKRQLSPGPVEKPSEVGTVRAFVAGPTGDQREPSTLGKRSTPPSPCPVCHDGMHWARFCPKRAQNGSSQRQPPRQSKWKGSFKSRESAKQATNDSDGVLVIGASTFKFVIDTGASKTFINAKHAHFLAQGTPGVSLVALEEQLLVDIADSSGLKCNFKIITPAVLVFETGEQADLQVLELYAVEGLRLGEVLLGRSTLKALGVDVVSMTKSMLLAKAVPALDDATSTSTANSEHLLVTTAKKTSNIEGSDAISTDLTEQLEDRFPDVNAHNPTGVRVTIDERLCQAQDQGLSEASIEKLRQAFSSDLFDIFRNNFSDDPPAKVAPIKVEMLPSVYEIKPARARRYHKDGSMAMAAIMTRLEKYKYVYRNNLATVVSPAYPVKKHGVDPSAPLEDQYRLTVDLRAVNACTIPTKFPLPRLESFMERVAGKRFFGTLDLFGGYWQLPLHPDSQQFFSILTDAGIWTPLRLIQGSRNAAGPFQAIVGEVLGDALYSACVQYIDDVMVFGATEEEFIDNWILVLKRLHSVGLKVSAKKTQFYAKSIKYCGRIFTPDGATFDKSLIEAITNMPTPTTAEALRRYLASTNWIRSSIPRYAEVVQPLQDLLNQALATGKTSNLKPASIQLHLVGWSDEHDQAFRDINLAVTNSVMLAYPTEGKSLCVFTDASSTHWAGLVTQTSPEEHTLHVLDQNHQPLAFVSGAFHGASTKWPTVEKEGYAILETCLRMEHVLRRPDGFKLFTDHNNLQYLFSPKPSAFTGRKAAGDRVERWAITLRGFNYEIHHIPGEDNVFADLLTRWGASPHASAHVVTTRLRSQVQSPAADPSLSVSTTDVLAPLAAAVPTPTDAAQATQPPRQRGHNPTTKVTPGSAPSAAATMVQPSPLTDHNPTFTHNSILDFSVDDAPTLDEIRRAQSTLSRSDITRYNLKLGDRTLSDLYVDKDGRIFVPDTRHLRLRLCIVAHQGLGGHRGSDTTAKWLTDRFTWPTVHADIRTMCFACLHCLRTKGGKTIPRPWMHIPAAHGPNEVLHFDYIYIRAAEDETTPEYALIIVDGFSRFTWLTAHRSANATNVVTSLLQWFGLFGVARKWVSDQGTHFLNDVMEQLRYRLGAEHRFTTAYAPWSNGIVERVGRSLRETVSAFISETKRPYSSWPLLLPVINNSINMSPSDALGGRSPITAFTGRSPSSPLDIVFTSNTAETVPLSNKAISDKIRALEAALSQIITAVRGITPRVHPTRPGVVPVDFDVGDFVLVANSLHGKRDKTAPLWKGPGLVIKAENERSFAIQDLLSGVVRVVHAEHIKRYSDSSLKITPQLTSFIAAQAIHTRVEAILAHRKEAHKWKLLVSWQGFTEEEATWEDLTKLTEDVPEIVQRYVKAIQEPDIRLEMSAIVALSVPTATSGRK